MAITIYILINKANGKQYIGQTNNFKRRMCSHKGSKGGDYLHRAIQKCGWDNFEMKPLCIVEDYMADETEQKCIESYGTLAPNGYNLTGGGQKNRGSYTEEVKQKISDAMKGKPSPLKGRTSLSKGKPLSEAHKRKMSEAHKGKTLSVDTRRKISEAKAGIKPSEETLSKAADVCRRSVVRSDGIKYNSLTSASFDVKGDRRGRSHISAACKSGKKRYGFYWKYEEDNNAQ